MTDDRFWTRWAERMLLTTIGRKRVSSEIRYFKTAFFNSLVTIPSTGMYNIQSTVMVHTESAARFWYRRPTIDDPTGNEKNYEVLARIDEVRPCSSVCASRSSETSTSIATGRSHGNRWIGAPTRPQIRQPSRQVGDNYCAPYSLTIHD